MTDEGKPKKRIGDIAVESGILKREDLERCVKKQKKWRESGVLLKLGQVMIREDLISTRQLVELLEEQKRANQD